VRQQLEETLTENVIVPVEVGPVLDALAPLVECIANERAAQVLEAAADTLPSESEGRWLRDLAVVVREVQKQEAAR